MNVVQLKRRVVGECMRNVIGPTENETKQIAAIWEMKHHLIRFLDAQQGFNVRSIALARRMGLNEAVLRYDYYPGQTFLRMEV